MKEHIEKFIEKLEDELPPLLSPRDLIKFGIFSNRTSINVYRKKGIGPDWIVLAGRFMYPKECVIEWVRVQNCPIMLRIKSI